MSANRPPIESFGPTLFNALIEGSRREYRIPTSYRNAARFRHRAHMLRSRMQQESHPLYPVASRTRITIEWDETKIPTKHNRRNVKWPENIEAQVTLVIAPHDLQFDEALKAAGLILKPSTIPETPESTPTVTPSDLDALLNLKPDSEK